ncbi:MAG: RNA pseudouridine synthase [Cytophagales bacterium]|nr:MAG: RNA pseudouridine synthase [Cytophagales bacterium]
MKRLFDVLYEDNHLLVVNKRAGVPSQPDESGDLSLVDAARQYLKDTYDKPGNVFCGLIHRLDRPVSGLVLLTKTSKCLERMNKLFKDRKVHKVYWAITNRRPQEREGKLTHWLVKDTQRNRVEAYDYPHPDAQKAELRYRYIGEVNKHFLIEVTPLTGRPHQIRVQLASMGCPIRGDVKYGYSRPNKDGQINLHARRVDFIHPIKKEPFKCVAGLPQDYFWEEFLTLEDYKISDKNLDFLH